MSKRFSRKQNSGDAYSASWKCRVPFHCQFMRHRLPGLTVDALPETVRKVSGITSPASGASFPSSDWVTRSSYPCAGIDSEKVSSFSVRELFCPIFPLPVDLLWKLFSFSMPPANPNDDHERFTRLLLESEPVMLRSILVSVPHLADAREIMQETAVALWRQFETYDSARPFLNWAMGFSRIETRRFLSRESRRAQLTEKAVEALE